MQNRHTHLIKCMQALGYKADPKGVCVGYTNMWIQAILCNDKRTFGSRLVTIMSFNEHVLASEIARLRQVKSQLSDKEKLILSIPAFFEGIELHQQPMYYTNFFDKDNKTTSQNIDKSSVLTSPILLSGDKQLTVQEKTSGIYHQKNLKAYFSALKKTLRIMRSRGKIIPPFAIQLNNANHTIAIGFSGFQISFCNINESDEFYLYTANEFSKNILKAFDEKKRTAFSSIFCCSKNNRDIISEVIQNWKKELSARGQEVQKLKYANLVDSHQRSWLYFASLVGEKDVVDHLIATSKPIVFSNALTKVTPLAGAAIKGNAEIVRMLIDHKVDIHCADSFGRLPIHKAAINGNIDCVNELLKAGSKITIPDNENYFPIHYAAYYGHDHLIKLLLDNNKLISAVTKDLYTPLHMAVERGHHDTAAELIKLGADLKTKTTSGKTSFDIAVDNQDFRMQKLLKPKPILSKQSSSQTTRSTRSSTLGTKFVQ